MTRHELVRQVQNAKHSVTAWEVRMDKDPNNKDYTANYKRACDNLWEAQRDLKAYDAENRKYGT